MALTAGTRFGPYEIVEQIGTGGMGEVYRATDTNLKRDVAIKVLPESFAADADRLARFQREAEVLASLNHPKIAQIYGLEKADEKTAIVMELVEGPTLADRLREGPIPADEALNVAMQITEALEAAHGRQIVHRDLKPANIKLSRDGAVKVLDFGIAKAIETQTGISGRPVASLTTPAMTQAGVVLGTASYMSPEQARGRDVDQRTDIWAFGCVLYEMLTGQLAFGGEDVPETLARIIAKVAEMGTLPGTTSPAVRHAIELCLEKDAAKRIADIRDVRLALQGRFDPQRAAGRGAAAAPVWRKALVLAGTLAVGAAGAGLGVYFMTRPAPAPVNRFAYLVPDEHQFRGNDANLFAMSPDGRRYVYNTNDGLYLREMDQLEPHVIPGTEGFLRSPTFSPDGQSIAYRANGQLLRIATSGGAPVVIAGSTDQLSGLTWNADDSMLFGQLDGIYRVPATGGTPALVFATDTGETLAVEQLLPDGDTVLMSARRSQSWDTADVVAGSLATGNRTVLIHGGSDARYVPAGHLVYAFDDGLFAQAFDPATLTVSGAAVPLVQGVSRALRSPSANYSITEQGTLAYLAGSSVDVHMMLVWIDRDGREEPVNVSPRNYVYAQLSPDGTQVALDTRGDDNDIWIFDLRRETLQRLTLDPGANRIPIWMPDGRVVFSREIDGVEEVYVQAADGSGVAEQLTSGSIGLMMPNDVSPDGKTLLYMAQQEPRDIWMIGIGDDPSSGKRLIVGAANEYGANISPDGHWVAYQSDEAGEWEVYVRPFPDVDSGRTQVSRGGGTHPLWSRDGTELFYLDLGGQRSNVMGALMVVPVEYEPKFVPGPPELLFENKFEVPQQMWSVYHVSPDGRHFLMFRLQPNDDSAGAANRIVIVQNWLGELERLVPTR